MVTYQVVTSYNAAEGYWRGICYRNGKTLTMVKARSEAKAVKEVRRQVRLVRSQLVGMTVCLLHAIQSYL